MAHLFISYSRKDFPVVDRLRNDLRDAGISVWIDKVGLTPGTLSWEQALRDAIRDADAVLICASPDSRKSPHVQAEVALALAHKKPIFPAWVAGDDWLDSIVFGLFSMQYADLRGDSYAGGLLGLVAAIGGETTTIAPLMAEETPIPEVPPDFVPRNPYKGLRAFHEADQPDFFGRGALVDDLLAHIEDAKRAARLLAVLGASGSGKSSVIMAGLLPKLREKHPDWVYLDPMVPGAQPLENLSIALADFLPYIPGDIRRELGNLNTRGLHVLAKQASKGRRLFLYIDQFEEIFTQANEAESRQFIDLLSTAVTEPNGVLYLLLSMRADFYDRPLQFTPFGKLVETHHAAITSMTLADLYDVIQKPAALPDVRLTFDDGLVTEMVFAVRKETAALPLLQFTLDQLFERRDGCILTLNAYREMGGIQGALARHADTTYQNLPTEQHRTLARALFLRLIEPGQTEQDTTRRRATTSELTLPDVEQTRILQETADAFVNARLLVSNQTDDTRTLEVSHEALIREWKRLGEWLHAAREDLRLQKKINVDAATWVRAGKPEFYDGFYRGTLLADAQLWVDRSAPSIDETDFVAKSEAAYLAEIVAETRHKIELQRATKESRDMAELAKAQTEHAEQQQLRARRAIIGVMFFIIMAVGIGMFAVFQVNMANNRISELNAIAPGATQGAQWSRWASMGNNLFRIAEIGLNPVTRNEHWVPVEMEIGGFTMVLVPAGCFMMGSDNGDDDEKPIHQQCFSTPFWIDKFEVTNAQYGSPGCERFVSEPNQPRDCLSWNEARSFCEILRGARLPTEAEWEYAARGPDGLAYPWGNEFIAENTVYPQNSNAKSAPVGSKPGGASWVGALDMSGNVWEWVSSLYHDYPYNDSNEGNSDGNDKRVLRGGAFYLNVRYLRSADRTWHYERGAGGEGFGFRCARDVDAP